jgi:hypothetical protein
MFRKLTAIEIAEGALLADIGVILQLLALYFPIGKTIFHVVTPIVFTIIVLRRGFYTGLMSMTVAMFLIAIVSGPGHLFLMILEGGAGVFLGLTMKIRLNHLALILLGTTSGAVVLYVLLLASNLVFGISLATMAKGLQLSINGALTFVGLAARVVGLNAWWQHAALPALKTFIAFALAHFLITFYLANWVIVLPVVVVVFYITNLSVRLLGYQVRPFLGVVFEKYLFGIIRMLTGLLPKRLRKHGVIHAIAREVRRQGIARRRAEV